MKNIINKILIISLFAAIISCQNGEDHGHSHEGHDHGTHEVPENEVHLTNAQVKTIGVELGGFMEQKMADFISVTGMLDVPPNAVASVHVPEGGFVRNLNKFIVGSYIKKGQLIATLENPNFIQKQQEYLEIRNEMVYLDEEVKRQKRLSEANASALKNYQKAKSEYAVKQVQLKGIAEYLKYLGVNLNNLENEKITKSVAIVSPSSGYISAINVHNGMFAQPEMELLKIVNDTHINIELEVFEKDIHRVKVGQKLTFELASNPNETYNGKVYLIAPTFENDKKTIHVNANIIGQKPKFHQGAFVNAKIWENETTVPCLPEKAVVSADGISYIFALKQRRPSEIVYQRIPVKVKQKKDGWVSVNLMEALPDRGKDKIVQNAAFYMIAEMNKGTTAHSHSH